MLPNIGVTSLILIIIVALIIFGPSKLPEIGKAAGQTLREFKNSTRDMTDDEEKSDTQDTSESQDKAEDK